MEDLKVSLIQSDLKWKDKKHNLYNFDKLINSINDTDLIVLPEVFNTGVNIQPENVAENMDGNTIKWMKQKAKERDSIIAGSLTIEEDGKYYNRLIWMQPDGNYEYYDKHHLFRLGDEYKYFEPGHERKIVEYKGWKFCLQVCYDLRFPVWSRNVEEFDCIVYVANWPHDRTYAWDTLLPARAIENQCYTIGVNRVGEGNRGEYHSGDSMVVNPRGKKICSMSHVEMVQTIQINKEYIKKTRNEIPFLQDRNEFTIHYQN